MNVIVTMADVAKRAGVHPTTVSMALRNHPSIPEATRVRLQLLAREMGYRRDPALSALVAYRNQVLPRSHRPTLAYLTNWHTRWGWRNNSAHHLFFLGAGERASALGYQLEHFWLGEPGLTTRRMSDILFSRGITGLVVASHLLERSGPLDFDWSHFSAVKIDYLPREPSLNIVTNDQRSIIGLALARARAAGYRRIGLVMPWWWDEFADLAWSAGFLSRQQTLPASDRIPILYYSSEPPPEGRPASEIVDAVPRDELARWLEAHQPDVVLSYGVFVLGSLARLGIAVPGDLAFADIHLSEPDGRTAGVYQNCLKVGELAIELLAGQLQQHAFGLPKSPTSTIVEGQWFDGASMPPRSDATGPAPAFPAAPRSRLRRLAAKRTRAALARAG